MKTKTLQTKELRLGFEKEKIPGNTNLTEPIRSYEEGRVVVIGKSIL